MEQTEVIKSELKRPSKICQRRVARNIEPNETVTDRIK